MPSPYRFRRITALLCLVLALVGTSVLLSGVRLQRAQALLIRKTEQQRWKVLTEEDVVEGATIPADTNVVIHLPFAFDTIDREILFGQKGDTIRYWGYCFPQNYDPELVKRREGLPGILFLSEKERKERDAKGKAKSPVFSLKQLPTREQIENVGKAKEHGVIRHQLEMFLPGMLCYVMTEVPLAIGLDDDGDGLNTKIENGLGTDPLVADTDTDGVTDGVEHRTGGDPLSRDSDSDGLIDGLEDANANGWTDLGETNARARDTDRDGLCDGMCFLLLGNRQKVFAGEDKNLDGIVDEGETDPRQYSTPRDGISDMVPFLQCLAQNKNNC